MPQPKSSVVRELSASELTALLSAESSPDSPEAQLGLNQYLIDGITKDARPFLVEWDGQTELVIAGWKVATMQHNIMRFYDTPVDAYFKVLKNNSGEGAQHKLLVYILQEDKAEPNLPAPRAELRGKRPWGGLNVTSMAELNSLVLTGRTIIKIENLEVNQVQFALLKLITPYQYIDQGTSMDMEVLPGGGHSSRKLHDHLFIRGVKISFATEEEAANRKFSYDR